MWLNCCCVFILDSSIVRQLHILETKDQVYYLNEATYEVVVGARPLFVCKLQNSKSFYNRYIFWPSKVVDVL